MTMTPQSSTVFESGFSIVAKRQMVITANDLQSCCDHSIPIADVEAALDRLTVDGTLIRMSLPPGPCAHAYVIKDYATRWWIRSVLSWYETGAIILRTEELARSMSSTFGEVPWHEPEPGLLQLGTELGMIGRTEHDKTFVSPWANLLRLLPWVRQFLLNATRAPRPSEYLTTGTSQHLSSDFLGSLDPRQSFVFSQRCRAGRTLEEIGDTLGLTRERVRQIESSVMRRHDVEQALSSIVVDYFVNNSWSVVVDRRDESVKQPLDYLFKRRKLHLDALETIVLMPTKWVKAVNQITSDRSTVLAFAISGFSTVPEPLELLLSVLPFEDASRIRGGVKAFLRQMSEALTRKSQAYVALKIIGKAAHYTEVIEVCDSLWPNRSGPTEAYINALAAAAKSSENGVVHIGRKGMYGLSEHGYSKPTQSLTETVAEIVHDEYAQTGRPVSADFVINRIRSYRHDPDTNSVKMALSFHNELKSVGNSMYVPTAAATGGEDSKYLGPSSLDFSSALGRLKGRDNPPNN